MDDPCVSNQFVTKRWSLSFKVISSKEKSKNGNPFSDKKETIFFKIFMALNKSILIMVEKTLA